MHAVRYRPEAHADAWRAAVTPTALAVLSPDVTPRAAETVWRRLDGGGIAAVLDALTSAFGTSLTAIPPFALVVPEPGGVRVAVRGAIELVVESAAGTDAVSGHGVATWVEQFVADVHRVTVSVGSAGDLSDALPISSGVVPVAALEFTLEGAPSAAAPAAAPAPAPSAPAAPVPSAEPVRAAEPVLAPEPAPASAPLLPPEPVLAPEPAADQPTPVETVAPPEATEAVPGADDEDLWGATVAVPRPNRAGPTEPVAPAAPAPAAAPAPTAPVAPAAEQLGDHDGATISVAEFRALRDGVLDGESTEIVPARTPARGRVRISDGRVVELERTVVIGRRPRSTRPAETELPTLVAVDGPQHDISRNHVELRAEGETILAVDLDSTNGTLLRRGAQDPVRLHPHEPTIVVDGDVLDLGDGVTLSFEGLR